jgi:sugar phosphate isomerase/epimerase
MKSEGLKNMQIGTCVPHGKGTVARAFQKMRENGFKQCQLLSWDRSLWNGEESDYINRAIQQYDIEITAFWCGWGGPVVWDYKNGHETLGLVPPAYRFSRMQDLMNGANFAKDIGVKNIVTHVGYIPENPNDSNYPGLISALRYVIDYFKANGQNFLFETGQETPVTLLRAIEDIGRDNAGINLDTGNLIIYGKGNPIDALDVFGKHVMGLHMKDAFYPTSGYELGTEVQIGAGKVDFQALIIKLHQLNYNGSLTIEREIEGEQQTKEILESRALLEKYIQGASL